MDSNIETAAEMLLVAVEKAANSIKHAAVCTEAAKAAQIYAAVCKIQRHDATETAKADLRAATAAREAYDEVFFLFNKNRGHNFMPDEDGVNTVDRCVECFCEEYEGDRYYNGCPTSPWSDDALTGEDF